MAPAFLFILAQALGLAQSPPPYTISTVAGTCTASGGTPPCTAGYGGDNGPAASAQLSGPSAVAFDSSGNLYIADTCNQRVREVSTTGTITTVAGSGTVTQGCKGTFSGDGGAATSAGLNSPSGLAFDSSGNLYIADSDNFEVRKVTGGTISTVAGKNSAGAGFAGDLGPAINARLWNPTGVAVDSAGNIYIADPFDNVVSVVCANQTPIACTSTAFAGFTWAAGDINTFAGNNTNGPGYSGDGGPATAALVNNPNAVTLDAGGNLYIADTGNNAVRKVDTSGKITTVAGNGVAAYAGDGGQAIQASLNAPKGIAVDSNGNLFIADHTNCAIRMVEPGGIITTIAGTPGSCGFSGDGGAATSAQLYFPSGVAVNGGKVYIADNTNNVIRLLTPAPAIPQINAGGVVDGASYKTTVVPGSIADVFGAFFLTSPSADTTLPLVTSLQNLSLQFGGSVAAPLYFVSGGQVNIQVPWDLTGTTATLAATLNGQTGAPQNVNLAPFAPAIFSVNSQGTGQGAILDASFHLVDTSNKAIAGTTNILIYCTGLGAVSENQPATGAPASLDAAKLAHTATFPTVTIGGIGADVSFSGLAPGFVGLYQVNALVPAGVASGDAVPVVISMGQPAVTSNTVTIAVQ